MRLPDVFVPLARLAARAPRAGLAVASLSAALLVTSSLAACGGGDATPARFPARAAGCEVQVFQAAPKVPTENLGTVQASCDDFVSDEDCLRTLKDETCKLGGDVVWGVDDKPRTSGSKKTFSGRAAHTAPGGA